MSFRRRTARLLVGGTLLTLLALLGPIALGAVVVPTLPGAARADEGPGEGFDPCADVPRAFFDDVEDTGVHAAGIDCLVWSGISRGVSYERYGALDGLTRGQLASLLDRTIAVAGIDLPDPAQPPFGDVDGVHAGAIGRLAQAGIVSGRSDVRFEPDALVRRDQLATMVVHAYATITSTSQEPESGDASDPVFADVAGNVHRMAILRAVELDLVQGVDATTYGVARSATRGQIATVLARLLRQVTAGDVGVLSSPPGGYATRVGPLDARLEQQVRRWTWRSGCPVPPSRLAQLEVVFVDLAGVDRWGVLVVHEDHADTIAQAFGALYDDGFPIDRMEPVERFAGDDDASMAANNTSAFNCRRVTGSSSFSQHAYGWAIDINPIQNPYVRGDTVLPPAGRAYTDRSDVRPGMLVRPGPVTAFDAIGWGWGGDWSSLKDYQHLSLTGN